MTAMFVIAGCVAGASIVLWLRAALTGGLGRNLLHRETDSMVPWGLVDVYAVLVICFFVVPLAYQLATDRGENAAELSKSLEMTIAAALRFAAVIASIVYLVARHKTTLSELGLSLVRFPRHFALGLIVSVMLIPPVMLIHYVVSLLIEYKHETIDQLNAGNLLAAILSAGIATPIFEEFLFRGVIQGFLQRWGTPRNGSLMDVVLGRGLQRDEIGKELEESVSKIEKATAPTWPIFVSSTIFAAMHLGQGAAPIPLFLLAVGLGYVFWRTHSLIPCIIVHIILNVWSLVLVVVHQAANANQLQ